MITHCMEKYHRFFERESECLVILYNWETRKGEKKHKISSKHNIKGRKKLSVSVFILLIIVTGHGCRLKIKAARLC